MSRRTSKNARGKRRRSPFRLLVLSVLVVTVAVIGIILLNKYRTYTDYQVDRVISMSNSEENTEYYFFGKGYLKCAGDGLAYFDERGMMWNEYFTMLQPLVAISGDYVAVADMTQRNVYLYDKSGYVNRINLSHNITDVEVSDAGMIAVASNDGNINYIELRDRNGNEIMTEKSIFSSRGFLMDLTLSHDGSRLAAVYTSIEKGTLKSSIVCYDLSGSGGSENIIAATFDQYESVMLTTVRFMEQDILCAVGDTAISLYRFSEQPELIYEELDLPYEIQCLFFSGEYVGMITEEPDTDTRYRIKALDLSGNLQLDIGTDFSYNRADFAGDNVLLYSYNECLMYSLAGIEKMYLSFDRHIEALKSADGRHFVYGTNSETEFITLR